MGNWDFGRLSHLPKVTELLSDERGLWIWLYLSQRELYYENFTLAFKSIPITTIWYEKPQGKNL